MKVSIPIHINSFCNILKSHGFEGRIVGGYVRDILNKIVPTEVDLATNALPQDVIAICNSQNIRCIPTGIKHGTVTVLIQGYSIEVTTLRQDKECDGRHANVNFTSSWQDDAMRRDFTINAMYINMNGYVIDYFNGQDDLKASIVRFIGNPEQRIHEDYLRILRYFRFLGYFEKLNIHQQSFESAVKLSSNLNKLSIERVRVELLKVLSCRFKPLAIQVMLENRIFSAVGFNFKFNDLSFFCDDPIINLAALMKISELSCDIQVLKKFTNSEQKTIYNLLKTDFVKEFEAIMNNMILQKNYIELCCGSMHEFGQDFFIKLFKMYFILNVKCFEIPNPVEFLNYHENILQNIILKKFPLNGNDISELGYKNQEIGEKLKLAKKLWIDSSCTISKQQLITLIK